MDWYEEIATVSALIAKHLVLRGYEAESEEKFGWVCAQLAVNFLTSAANQPELPLDVCIVNFLKVL